MENDIMLVFRLLSFGLFLVTCYAGYYMWKHYDRFFGTDRTMPSENSSARAYSKVQVWSLWAHLLFASGAFALLLH